MRTLLFDAGNTRLKWQLRQAGQPVTSGVLCNSDDWDDALPALLDKMGKLDQVGISIVSGNERFQQIKNHVLGTQTVPIYKAEAKKYYGNVTLAYNEPEKLGVDRWLAMLAAHAMATDDIKVIVDCGTAITVDVLDRTGQHLGGYIVPGVGLMKKTLAANTARISFVSATNNSTALGNNSADCIHHGALAMAVALVDRVAAEHPGCRVILAGGDGSQLEHLISIYKEGRVSLMPDLVMDGLEMVVREA